MAVAFVQTLLENLYSLIRKEVGLLWGVDNELKALFSMLSTILSVLEDAELKQVTDKGIRNWLRKLKSVAYKLDDVLDECATEASRLQAEGENGTWINKVQTSFLSRFLPSNILFCRKIGSRMREVREAFDEIVEEQVEFRLDEVIAEKRVDVTKRRQIGSVVTRCQVYGRHEDKEKIVECLVKHVAGCDDMSIYAILGVGGLGKTIIAEMVFNDERVRRHFEKIIWVRISEDFGVKRVIKAIIESATGTDCEAVDLDTMQGYLKDILKEKRYLLVLDDVKNEDQEKWERLKHELACGSKGASIIVTTRIERVASMMATLPLHQLSSLAEDDCWSLFREHAFGHDKEESPNLVALGKEIVKKCGGVPLAVKSLGSLMRYKNEENEWLSIKESEIWNLPQDENSIFPALRLSYSDLPSELRQCFAYCAVFPKDFVIEKEDLVHLWMANGFLPSKADLEPEDTGNEIWNELYQRSFFQDVQTDDMGRIRGCKMHDLVHDLAQSIMEDECCITEAESSDNISKGVSHVTVLTDDEVQSYDLSNALLEVETMRTFLLQPLSSKYISALEFSCDFSKLTSLRVFGAKNTELTNLSSTISHLKHLRYLDFSSTFIQMLPESVCTLFNLQTLKLDNCCRIRELPKHMRLLKKLRHLYLDGCSSLSEMPQKIGEIDCLKTLTLFVVGERGGSQLAELKRLNLGGTLRIEHLERVSNSMDAKEANLVGKPNLRSLYLSWGDDDTEFELQEKVLEALEPHPNLERLVIEGYKGSQFPLWLRDQILSNVVSIELSGCKNCSQLPPMGKLPSLRDLTIKGMNQMLYMDHNFQSGGVMRGFPSLMNLTLTDLPSLQRLSREDGRELLPSLANIRITNCPQLTLPSLPSLKELSVMGCNEVLLGSVSNLRSLNGLFVYNNDDSVYLPQGMLQNLTSLHSLTIENFSKLKELPTELVSLHALKSVRIFHCLEFESFPEQGLEGLNCLQSLSLMNCPKLSYLPASMQSLTQLQNLDILQCPELVKRCQKGTGEDWYKIAHVPNVFMFPPS